MIENEINNQAGYKTICTSDIDKDATVSYAAIHYGLTEEMINTYEHYPPKEEMAKFLSDRNVGFDFKKGKPYDWAKLARRKDDYEIKKYYLASVLSNNLGDIVRVDEKTIGDFNVMVFGFPCQTFSIAGNRKGFEDIRGTMFFEAWRILKESKPKLFIFENVAGLLSHDNGRTIEIILSKLGELNYEITMDLLNSKDFGIPQNRSRAFCIGRLLEDA